MYATRLLALCTLLLASFVGADDDIVKEFKSGVAEKLEESDFETHYNLGVAYKEMGLQEEALLEFQKAARYPEKSRTAYTSISMIYRDLGNFTEARSSLRLALSVPSNESRSVIGASARAAVARRTSRARLHSAMARTTRLWLEPAWIGRW